MCVCVFVAEGCLCASSEATAAGLGGCLSMIYDIITSVDEDKRVRVLEDGEHAVTHQNAE